MTEYYKNFIKGTLIVLILGLISKLIAYFTRFFMAKNLSLEEFGLFYAVLSLILLLAVFRTLGLDSALLIYTSKYFAKNDYKKMKSMWQLLIGLKTAISVIVAFVLLIFAESIAINFFKTIDALPVLHLLILYFILIGFFDSFSAIFRGFNRNFLFSIFELANTSLIFIFLLIMLQSNISSTVPAIAYTFSTLISVIIILFVIKALFPNFFKIKASLPKQEKKKIIIFSLTAFIHSMAGILLAQTDILMLTYFTSLEHVAFYNAVLPLANLLVFFSGMLSFVLLNLGKQMLSMGKRKELLELIQNLKKYVFIIVLTVAVIAAVYSYELLYYLFGPDYAVASNSLAIYLLGTALYSVTMINTLIFYIFEKPGVAAKIVMFVAVFNIVLNSILIPKIYVLGAVVTTVLGYILSLILTHHYSEKLLNVKNNWIFFPKMFRIGFASIAYLILAFTLRYYTNFSILGIILVLSISLIFYAAALFFIKAISKEELIFLTNLIKEIMPGKSNGRKNSKKS